MGLRVPLLSMNEMREFRWVSDEEDGGVVKNPVPVSFVCLEFDGEATRITSRVWRARLSSNRRPTDCGFDLLPRRSE
jgi:hypothetical protein